MVPHRPTDDDRARAARDAAAQVEETLRVAAGPRHTTRRARRRPTR